MINIVLFRHLQRYSKSIASGLLLALVATLSPTASDRLSIVPSVARAQNPPQRDAVQARLIGQWEGKDPSSNQLMTFIFTPEGKLFILFTPSPESLPALTLEYRINSTPQPMQMDVTLPDTNETVMTIFDFAADGQLRLQLSETNPGQPRPTAFNPSATLFQKVSENVTLPPNSQVVAPQELLEQADKARQNEGNLYIQSMNRAQQAYYLENNEFSTTIEQLGVGIKPETENYRYQIVSQGARTQSVMMTARAKNPAIRSYTGVVFAIGPDGEKVTISGICETDEPSSTPPAIPKAPNDPSEPIQCPVGSHLL